MSVVDTAILPLRRLLVPAAVVLLLSACARATYDEFRPYDEKADAKRRTGKDAPKPAKPDAKGADGKRADGKAAPSKPPAPGDDTFTK